uniref:Uncharacterized protein n=1 Tax=Romanomermis culicivorax TaxID=13658 RepID=A0A915HI09_ROMCU
HPYSNCLLDAPSGYSTNACYESCEQLAILTHCDCGDPQLPLINGTNYCGYDSEMCVEATKSFGNFSPSFYGCSCPPPCKSVTYDRTLSSAKLSLSSAKLASFFEKFTMLVSDLAQFMGLWLGFSAITFFEIIPLILSLCGCRSCHNIRH